MKTFHVGAVTDWNGEISSEYDAYTTCMAFREHMSMAWNTAGKKYWLIDGLIDWLKQS